MPKPARAPRPDADARLGALQDELRQRDRTISDLKIENHRLTTTLDDMAEQLEESSEVLDRWKEAFAMVQDADGVWRFEESDTDAAWIKRYRDLARRWNKFVPEFNAVVQPRDRGRPLDASDAQVAEIRSLRKRGLSLRGIAEQTGRGLQTVRTVLDRDGRRDRTSKRRIGALLEREADPGTKEALRQMQAREALPKRIAAHEARTAELLKAAKGLGR